MVSMGNHWTVGAGSHRKGEGGSAGLMSRIEALGLPHRHPRRHVCAPAIGSAADDNVPAAHQN